MKHTPLAIILLAVFITGCQGTRLLSGLGIQSSTTIDPHTGKPVVSAGLTFQFRDARDAKTIRQPSVR